MHFAKCVSRNRSEEREGWLKQCEGKAVSLFQLQGSRIMFVPQCNLSGTKAYFVFTEIDFFLSFPLQKILKLLCTLQKQQNLSSLPKLCAGGKLLFFSIFCLAALVLEFSEASLFWKSLFLVCLIFLCCVNGRTFEVTNGQKSNG